MEEKAEDIMATFARNIVGDIGFQGHQKAKNTCRRQLSPFRHINDPRHPPEQRQ